VSGRFSPGTVLMARAIRPGVHQSQSSAGKDHLTGRDGHDVLVGNAGNDRLYGDAGNDVLYARDSAYDILHGGDGDDQATWDANDLLHGPFTTPA
jgi:Ca2+-binding RTX toxin-like protein